MYAVLTAGGRKGRLEFVLALAHELRLRGHEVVLAVPPELESDVAGCGLKFVLVGSELFEEPVSSSAGSGARISGEADLQPQMHAKLDSFHLAYRAFLEICRDADVLVGAPHEFVCGMIQESLCIPYVSLHSSPFDKVEGNDERGAAWFINLYRKKEGLSLLDGAAHRNGDGSKLALCAVSPHLSLASLNYAGNGHATGFFITKEEEEKPDDPGLVAWCSVGEPFLVIHLENGLHAVSESLIAIAIQAARQVGLKTVLQLPGHELDKESLPERVYVTDCPRYGWLFSRAALVVHGGGTQVTASALRAGRPSVIVPAAGNQHGWPELVRAAGCARNVIPVGQLNAARLAAAIRGTLASAEVRSAAAVLGEQIRNENGLEKAVTLIEQLVKHRHHPETPGNRDETRADLAPRKAVPRLVRAKREGDLPLSYAQQRLWFLCQLNPESTAYNMSGGLRMIGKLDQDALQRTFDLILSRHETLRTCFPAHEGRPFQQVAAAAAASIERLDLTNLHAGEGEARARAQALEEMRTPFDLGRSPLLRLKLLRLSDQEHVLLLTMHHIISDGWSVHVLMREVSSLYAAFTAGLDSPLAELPIQYGDYSIWQQSWLTGEVLGKELDYWKGQLRDLAVLDLPTDHPRPPKVTANGAIVRFGMSREMTRGLKEIARNRAASLFMGLMAGFQALLSRYALQYDITVGSPIANRKQKEVDDLIGFFANTLVIRVQLTPATTFQELLQQVKETTLGAYAHQDVPFERLVEVLQPQRDLSRSPLFQVMFAMQNIEQGHMVLPGLQLSDFGTDITEAVAKFDLGLNLAEVSEQLAGSLEYNTDLFDSSTIANFLQRFQRLLEGVVKDPGRRISDYELLVKKSGERS